MIIHKKYSLVKDHPKHFEIHDETDNKTFHVAKKDLHPATQIKLMKMKKYSGGGEIEGDIDKDRPDKFGSAMFPGVLSATAAPTGNSNPEFGEGSAAPISAEQNMSLPQTQYSDQLANQKPVPTAPDAAPLPPGPMSTSTPSSMMDYAFDQQRAAAGKMYEASEMKANAEAGAYGKATNILNQVDWGKKISQAEADQNRYTKASEDLFNELQKPDSKVDPERYWDNHSKFAAGLGIILGGIGQGLMRGSSNTVVDYIQKNIDREVDSQKANINKKEGLLHKYMEAGLNSRQALTAYRSDLLTIAAAEVQKASGKANTALADAIRMKTLGDLGLQQAQAHKELALMGLNQDAMNKGVPAQVYSLLGDKMQERGVPLPDGTMAAAGSAHDAEKVKEEVAPYQTTMSVIGDLKNIVNNMRNLKFGSQEYARAQSAGQSLVLQLNDLAKSHRITDPDVELQMKTFTTPGFDAIVNGNARSEELERVLTNKMDNVYSAYVPAYRNMKKSNTGHGAATNKALGAKKY